MRECQLACQLAYDSHLISGVGTSVQTVPPSAVTTSSWGGNTPQLQPVHLARAPFRPRWHVNVRCFERLQDGINCPRACDAPPPGATTTTTTATTTATAVHEPPNENIAFAYYTTHDCCRFPFARVLTSRAGRSKMSKTVNYFDYCCRCRCMSPRYTPLQARSQVVVAVPQGVHGSRPAHGERLLQERPPLHRTDKENEIPELMDLLLRKNKMTTK